MRMIAGVLVELPTEEREPTIASIQRVVGARYGVSQRDILSIRQSPKITLARHVAAFLAQRLTSHSITSIARHFGDRDHSTISQCIKKIAALQQEDLALAATIQRLCWAIGEQNTRQGVHSFGEGQLSFFDVLSQQ